MRSARRFPQGAQARGPTGPDGQVTRDGYNLSYSAAHRWYYFPRMRPDEVLVFKIYDSGDARINGVPHTAFVDPTSPPDAAPRQSIEVRTISFIP